MKKTALLMSLLATTVVATTGCNSQMYKNIDERGNSSTVTLYGGDGPIIIKVWESLGNVTLHGSGFTFVDKATNQTVFVTGTIVVERKTAK